MSIEVHGLPPMAVPGGPVTVEDDSEQEETWAQTLITVAAATVAIVTVSVVGVLMAMA